MALEPIKPLEYITPHDPVPQRILNASRWFVVEVLELDFGDYVGRPSQHALVRVQLLSYLFSNGWYVDAVQSGGEGGVWESVSDTDASSKTTPDTTVTTTPDTTVTTTPDTTVKTTPNTTVLTTPNTTVTTTPSQSTTTVITQGSTVAVTEAQGSSGGSSSSQASSESFSTANSGGNNIGWADANGNSSSSSQGQSQSQTQETTSVTTTPNTTVTTTATPGGSSSTTSGESKVETTGETTVETTGTTEVTTTGSTTVETTGETTTESGSVTTSTAPYWFAYVRIRLKRRKLQAELVMKDMVEDLTKAYNEGRKINDDRYDELVNLYALMLGRTEDEGNGFILETADFKPLTDYVLGTMKRTVDDFHAVVDNLPDDVFKNRVREINLKFDNQLSKARVEMITAGLLNSTVWTTTASGIERNREMALNDLIEAKIDVYVKVAAASGELGQKFTDAAARLQQMAKDRLLDPAKLRNEVFKWMLDFMERRKDEFPGLDQIAGAAKQLGYAETTTSNGVK